MANVVLLSSDGEAFEITTPVAFMSQTVRCLVEDTDNLHVPLPNVRGCILARVVEYCKHHTDDAVSEEDLKVSVSLVSRRA